MGACRGVSLLREEDNEEATEIPNQECQRCHRMWTEGEGWHLRSAQQPLLVS